MVPSPRHCSLQLPDEFQTQLDRAIRSRSEDWIGRCLVGGVAAAAEGAGIAGIVEAGPCRSTGIVEVRMVENIEELGAELCGEPFFEAYIFDDRHIPVLEPRVTENVPARSTEGPGRWSL